MSSAVQCIPVVCHLRIMLREIRSRTTLQRTFRLEMFDKRLFLILLFYFLNGARPVFEISQRCAYTSPAAFKTLSKSFPSSRSTLRVALVVLWLKLRAGRKQSCNATREKATFWLLMLFKIRNRLVSFFYTFNKLVRVDKSQVTAD